MTLENQIRGLAVVFGARLPRALTAAFIDQALKVSEGIAGLSAAMRGLIAARTAVMTAVASIDADMVRMTRASGACRRLMTIPGVGQLTALAFVAAIDDPSRIHRSRDVVGYLGLVPKRYQSGEVDDVGGISKCGDRRVRTLLYEAANVMLTRYKGQLKLKDWAFAIARRSTMRKARIALARRLGIHHARHAAGRNTPRGVGKAIAETGDRIQLPQGATTQGGSRRRRRFCRTRPTSRLRFQPRRPVPSLPHQAPASAQRTQASQGVENREVLPLRPIREQNRCIPARRSVDVKRTLRIASTQVTVWGVAAVRLATVTGLN